MLFIFLHVINHSKVTRNKKEAEIYTIAQIYYRNVMIKAENSNRLKGFSGTRKHRKLVFLFLFFDR